MTDEPRLTVDDDPTEWIEVSRLEALQRLEQMLTEDLAAFEIDAVVEQTPVGQVKTYTFLLTTDDDDQWPALLALRSPGSPDEASMRWFVHCDLIHG